MIYAPINICVMSVVLNGGSLLGIAFQCPNNSEVHEVPTGTSLVKRMTEESDL